MLLISSGSSRCALEKNRTVVVLLGWLGSKQKHMKKYAEWYTSRDNELPSWRKAERTTLSRWLTIGADWLMKRIRRIRLSYLQQHRMVNLWSHFGKVSEARFFIDGKGCIVDSAPVAAADPTVWASGFSAAFLKKNSVATKGSGSSSFESTWEHGINFSEPKPAATETALLMILEKFFAVILNLPKVNRRLADVLETLSSSQPRCPQLYIYSSADRVIPAGQVESFIVEQRKAGHEVRACNFISSPHVDHFRSNPELYTAELNHFMDNFVLACCNHSS
ncbi:LOW QUALITY PROTEIN: hypothetical protein HID58_020543 [Brassica napus]|uniref:Transmembrane protein 53 n=1 Tax=Brassica napus TaxID=3708 RepID=A0ABQ7XGS7_BRANA|nr:LOW QUALITY PROTEIN: hypothetical protein HID58_020543 [Brassica napus]